MDSRWDEITCPVCEKLLLRVGLDSHIRMIAKEEVYSWYVGLIGEKPHQTYIETKKGIKKHGES